MNILHHKSWHVRNKDNIQRVRRDEANAAAEEKEKQKRKAIAESEARLNILRAKSSSLSGPTKQIDFVSSDSAPSHINLFEKEENGKLNEDKNAEVTLEKKQEQEKFEKKIGLLKYLVDEEDLNLKNQPWYKTVRDRKGESDDKTEVDLKSKRAADPLTSINTVMKEHEKKKKSKNKEKDYKKEKKSNSFISDEPPVKKSKTIEELRAERLKRETEERLKADRLLYGSKEPVKVVETNDRKRKYNNQFNPDYSKY